MICDPSRVFMDAEMAQNTRNELESLADDREVETMNRERLIKEIELAHRAAGSAHYLAITADEKAKEVASEWPLPGNPGNAEWITSYEAWVQYKTYQAEAGFRLDCARKHVSPDKWSDWVLFNTTLGSWAEEYLEAWENCDFKVYQELDALKEELGPILWDAYLEADDEDAAEKIISDFRIRRVAS